MAIYARQPDGTYKKVALLSYHLTDEILIADDSEVEVTSGAFTKLKEFTIFFDADTLRIYWEMKDADIYTEACAKIYKNDEPVTDYYSLISSDYRPYKVDVSADWKAGDKVQLYGRTSGGSSYFRNFRILGSFFASR